MNGISGIGNNRMIIGGQPGITKENSGQSFADRLKDLLDDVNEKQHTADESSEKVIKGELGLHEGMLAVSEADMSFRYLVKVREKVMQAYNEIRKMPV